MNKIDQADFKQVLVAHNEKYNKIVIDNHIENLNINVDNFLTNVFLNHILSFGDIKPRFYFKTKINILMITILYIYIRMYVI